MLTALANQGPNEQGVDIMFDQPRAANVLAKAGSVDSEIEGAWGCYLLQAMQKLMVEHGEDWVALLQEFQAAAPIPSKAFGGPINPEIDGSGDTISSVPRR
jgi:hypothetical protein